MQYMVSPFDCTYECFIRGVVQYKIPCEISFSVQLTFYRFLHKSTYEDKIFFVQTDDHSYMKDQT